MSAFEPGYYFMRFFRNETGLAPDGRQTAEGDRPCTMYDYARSGQYPLGQVMETAELASSGDLRVLAELTKRLSDKHTVVRYWAAMGCTIFSEDAAPAKDALTALTQDPAVSVRLAAAEALYAIGQKALAMSTLGSGLKSDNVMARVQALNILENVGEDARLLLGDIRKLLRENVNDSDYDVRAARRIVECMEGK